MAPEIIKGDKYNYKCYLYSIGVDLYYSVFREFPYSGWTEMQILNEIEFGGKLLLKSHLLSLDELLRYLLEKSPDKRISMKDYLNHKFYS